MDFLKGKKTYFVAAGAAVVVFAQSIGLLPSEIADTLLALLGAGGAATLGAKINRLLGGGS